MSFYIKIFCIFETKKSDETIYIFFTIFEPNVFRLHTKHKRELTKQINKTKHKNEFQ